MTFSSMARWTVLCVWALLSAGCALAPSNPEARAQSGALLDQQLQTVAQALEQTPKGKRALVYVGSAQHSQSLVFERDILLAQKRMTEINPRAQSILLSNQLQSGSLVYPFATQETLAHTFDRIAVWSKQYPLTLVVLISSHGNKDLLSVNINNTDWPGVRSQDLRRWLDALGNDTPVTLILSACYSGSLADSLAAPNRVILTAAAADRASFGCQFHSKNTYFVDQLLGAAFSQAKTWPEVFKSARQGVERLEREQHLSPPSNPQNRIPASLKDVPLGIYLNAEQP